jgi:hypothetical protein
MKQYTRKFFLLLLILTVVIPLNAQENTIVEDKQEISNNQTAPGKEKENNVKPKTQDVIKENKKTEANKTDEGSILKYPALAEEFKVSYEEHDPVGHTMVSFMYGLISGGLIGFGGGLSFYTSDTDMTNFYITAIATGGLGGIAGIVISLIENSKQSPYSIGMPVFQYVWYGVFAGALTGGLIGLIPYSTNESLPELLNWIGYGTFAGLATGIGLYFIIPAENHKNLILESNPLETKIGYKYLF